MQQVAGRGQDPQLGGSRQDGAGRVPGPSSSGERGPDLEALREENLALREEVHHLAQELQREEGRRRFCLRCFHPGWYAAVMGTGIVAVALAANPGNWSGLRGPALDGARAVAVLVALLMVGLAVPYAARIVRYPKEAMADFRSPVLGPMYATVPAGLLVAAVVAGAAGPLILSPAVVHDLVFWLAWVGVPLTFAVSVAFVYAMLSQRDTTIAQVSGSWFIPPVANIVVPLVLTELAAHADPATLRLLTFAGYSFWGMGFVLFLLVLSLLHDRLVLHPLPPAGMAPSLVIGLGPIGVGSLALLKLATASAPVFGSLAGAVATLSLITATVLWGFGLWWFFTTLVVMVRYLLEGPLPYGMGWWAFTFPLGAFTMATLALARAWRLTDVEYMGVGLVALLLVLWLVVTVRTLWASVSGEAWAPGRGGSPLGSAPSAPLLP
jgi:C4-dicarboxylate transporter/malic acid transport protein